MGKIAVTREYLEDIANSIREKNGTQETYKPSEMSDAIDNIQSGADLSEYFRPTISYGGTYDTGLSNMIKKIPSGTIVDGVTLYRAFRYSGIEEIPLLDTTNVFNFKEMFAGCTKLKTIPLLNASDVTIMEGMFYGATSFETLPQLNTPKLENMNSIFYGCSKLKDVPLLKTTKVTDMRSAFNSCPALTDNSLDNILQMCINVASYSRPKTLVSLGFNSTNYPSSRIQALPHYQDFINAGWSIGY